MRQRGGLLPEQTWDADDVPERECSAAMRQARRCRSRGRTPGLKLVRSLRDGQVFDRPPQPHRRYVVEHGRSPLAVWTHARPRAAIAAGLALRIETDAACRVRWSSDRWRTVHDTPSRDPGLGRHVADLPTADCPAGTVVTFTPATGADDDRWDRADFVVRVTTPTPA
ncbi:MAG: hypothetical protein R2708_24095 [Vicinamibacterales bacterium]